MAKNIVQEDGDIIDTVAPYAVASGAGALVGAMFGVAMHAAESGAPLALKTRGVVTLPKPGSGAMTRGAKVYWDDTGKQITTSATSNTLAGVVTTPVADGVTSVDIRLNGSF
ncbi:MULTISPECIES: DUF2190 family protein [Roseomonadaceae]|uniref:DUF2190 family protein n=1 Tax=Falsiroseomonas oleicola TaxID=2801474 RepID=A0ABS6H5Q2_9PROT|nr:DUF2190 family protein [Roseomonas oleicola]MBU8543990.1 DUF2190 family protein [Roseomonas oleicola]